MLYELARPLLFRLEPETAARVALRALHAYARLLPAHPPALASRRVMGLDFANPVGLAAGLDKNGEHIDALGRLGFGFIEVGTVTPEPQPGNPRPRLFRLPAASALINRMGFNNQGVDALVGRLRTSRYRGLIGVNIGKNLRTPVERAVDDYLFGLERVYPFAGYVTVNLSSPNTPGLRELQHGDQLSALLSALKRCQAQLADRHGRRVPLVVKIAPDLTPAQLRTIADTLLALSVDGVIATNTSAGRDGVRGLPHHDRAGGLSGAPLTGASTAIVRQLRERVGGRLAIIAAGGVMTAADVTAKLDAGADLVQVYTGLVYRGPRLVREALAAAEAFVKAKRPDPLTPTAPAGRAT